LARGKRELAGCLGARRIPAEAAALPRHELGDVEAALDLRAGILEGLSFFEGDQASQLLAIAIHQPRGFEKDFAARRRRHIAPDWPGRGGGLDRAFDEFNVRRPHAAEHLVGCGGIGSYQIGCTVGLNALAGDEMRIQARDAGVGAGELSRGSHAGRLCRTGGLGQPGRRPRKARMPLARPSAAIEGLPRSSCRSTGLVRKPVSTMACGTPGATLWQ
jgi:hypothetical protein